MTAQIRQESELIDYGRYDSAIGLNWYLVDPNLRFLMERHLPADQRDWAEAVLTRWGELCGGPVAARAETIDANPPRLERYDRWGEEIGAVRHHPEAIAQKRDIWNEGPQGVRARAGQELPAVLGSAWSYLLSQSDTGMVCATGMTGGVASLVERYAHPEIRERLLQRLRSPSFEGSWDGAMFMTEIRGGSDLARSETAAVQTRQGWALNGAKWFCSNVDARAIATLARPEGAPEGLRGLALFLVPAERADGSLNGIRIKRLKDKLGTRSVPTAEIDFVDAEAYPLSNPQAGAAAESEARGLNRMMSMVNGSRLGVAMMGLGIMRRSFLEASIYAARRNAFGKRLDELPLVRETLVEMALRIEATSAACFEASAQAGAQDEAGRLLYRILVPLAKLRAARGGVELASQALEIFGGNGYIENWPMARQLRDAQCHTIWEGTENIICLDVLRAIRREQAHEALMARVDRALAIEAPAHPLLGENKEALLALREQALAAIELLERAGEEIRQLHARRLAGLLADLSEGALLLEAAQHSLERDGCARRAAVARLFLRERAGVLRERTRITALRGIADDRMVLDLFGAITRYEPLAPSALEG